MDARRCLPCATTKVGLAYAANVPELLSIRPCLVDYIEVPFERLLHDPSLVEIMEIAPVILHCASLSVAGVVPPSDDIVSRVAEWANRTATPWLGEHLSFIRAPNEQGLVLDVGYSVAPPLNDTTLARVVDACNTVQDRIGVRMLLENPPYYFRSPGSSMDQATFFSELCEHSDIDILLDISHLLITAYNSHVDPGSLLERFPLHRAREIHLSGIHIEDNVAWDDHGVSANEATFEFLRRVLENAQPEAITLEYNWPGNFDSTVISQDVLRVRKLVSESAV